MAKLFFFILFLTSSCAHFTQDGSKRLKASETPDFLKALVPQNPQIKGVEYYKKQRNAQGTYKVKYELNDLEVSMTVDSSGKFIEKEEDLKFEDLPDKLKTSITGHLEKRFKKFRITETERRTDQDMKIFIDVEVVSSDKEKPFLEISFDLEGNYVSEEIEHVESLETLN